MSEPEYSFTSAAGQAASQDLTSAVSLRRGSGKKRPSQVRTQKFCRPPQCERVVM